MLTVPNGELETLPSLDFRAHTDRHCCPGQYPLKFLPEDGSIPFPMSFIGLHCLGNMVTFTLCLAHLGIFLKSCAQELHTVLTSIQQDKKKA